jgi:hypothetical protein
MRNLFPRSIIGLMAVGLVAALAFSSLAMAQAGSAGTKESLYDGNRLRLDPNPGGPAPIHEMNGSWAGNLTPERPPIPPMTPLGQKLFGLNKPETEFGTGHSNDPLNTCDPLGIPRNLVFETRGLAFATMPDRIAVLHQYQRVWRYVWMDGRELPKKFDTKDGLASRWYGYSLRIGNPTRHPLLSPQFSRYGLDDVPGTLCLPKLLQRDPSSLGKPQKYR